MQSSTISGHQLQTLGLQHLSGSLELTAESTSQILFVGSSSKLPESGFKGIIITELDPPATFRDNSKILIFKTTSIRSAMAQVLPFFDQVSSSFSEGIHPKAAVDPSAKLGPGTRVSAGAVIQAHVTLEANVWVGSGAIVEAGAQVGSGTRLHANTVVGFNCVVGQNCILHSGTVLGSDGFGFVHNPKGSHAKIPQIGRVIIGNNVEFGANCAVDRGTIGDTVVGDGSKFDNLCHVAHNCKIGKNGLFAGGFFISGSSEIGDHFMCGGSVAIADHIKICDHVTLGGRSTVTKDITQPGAYTGYPLEPLNEGLKTIANLRELTSLRKKLNQVLNHLGLNKE